VLTHETKEKIHLMHSVQKMSKLQISQKLGISRNTVIKILKENYTPSEQLLKDVQKVKDEHNESLIKILRDDDRLPSIVSKILNSIDNEDVIQRLVDTDNIRPLMTVVGVLGDKTIAAKRLKIEEGRLRALEKQVELKERELELRTTNPESFHTVQIINDADKYDKIETNYANTN
jgi:DNA-binding XRE family transcriptional regulator